MQDVFDKPVLLTGDSHVCVGGLAWGFADVRGKTMNPTAISRMIEDWMPNQRYREVNSTFAGLRQLYFYEGDSDKRQQAREVIMRIARENRIGKKIDDLVNAKANDFFPS